MKRSIRGGGFIKKIYEINIFIFDIFIYNYLILEYYLNIIAIFYYENYDKYIFFLFKDNLIIYVDEILIL